MEEDLLKGMYFSIICKDCDVEVKINGSTFELAALIATIAMRNRDVKEIIELAAMSLNAKEVFDELGKPHEHTTDH